MARYLTVVRETVHRYRTIPVVAATKKAARNAALEAFDAEPFAHAHTPGEEVMARMVEEVVDRDLPENAGHIASLPPIYTPAGHEAVDDDAAVDERRERQNELDRELMPAVGFDPDDA